MTIDFRYVCPQCKSTLSSEPEAYHCRVCQRRYPILIGIPDFRLFPDPYISIEEDHRKARALAEYYDELTFPELVARYWEMTPGVPGDLVRQYVRGALNHRERSVKTWAMLQSTTLLDGGTELLDIGCGTAGFLAAAGSAFRRVLGLDIAFRWLIIAKKRLEDLRMRNFALVCGCAEHLPFPDDGFDVAVAEDVLDHTRDQEAFVREGTRVLKRGGLLYLSTPNRYSVAPDPHVWVWGVGFLPGSLRDRYVRWRKGIPYGPIRPVSYVQLRHLLRSASLGGCRIVLPELSDLGRSGFSRWQRIQLRLYELMRGAPVVRHLLRIIGPSFQVMCRKGPSRS